MSRLHLFKFVFLFFLSLVMLDTFILGIHECFKHFWIQVKDFQFTLNFPMISSMIRYQAWMCILLLVFWKELFKTLIKLFVYSVLKSLVERYTDSSHHQAAFIISLGVKNAFLFKIKQANLNEFLGLEQFCFKFCIHLQVQLFSHLTLVWN